MDNPIPGDRAAFWGDYSCLYPSLSTRQTQSLEKAILARKLGRLQEAQRIFEIELPTTRSVPVLALEKGILLARLGLDRSRFSVLDEALKAQSKWPKRATRRVEDLLLITRVEAELLAYGATRRALQDARSFRDKLNGLEVDQWTDVDFGCALAYYSIIKFCYLHSSWIDVGTDLYFSPKSAALAKTTMARIVEVLSEQRKWNWALNFVRIQADFVEDDAKLSLYSNYLEQCTALPQKPAHKPPAGAKTFLERIQNALRRFQLNYNRGVKSHPDDPRTTLAVLDAQLTLANTMLSELELVDQCRITLDEVDELLERMPWIRDSDQQRRLLLKMRTDDFPLPDLSPVAKLSDLAAAAHVSGDRLMETQILARMRLRMNQVDHGLRDEDWHQQNDEFNRRYAALHADPNGRVLLKATVVSGLANTIVGTFRPTTDSSDYLYVLAEFEAAYPKFDIPSIQQSFYRGAAIALRALGRPEEADVADDRKTEAVANSSPDPTQFYRRYRDKPIGEWAPYLMEMILTWCEMEMRSGSLSVTETAQMLLVPVQDLQKPDGTPLHDLASSQSPHVLVERLYGSVIPVDAELWEKRLKNFETWLWHSPASVKRWIRHTILGDLQQARCALVMKYATQVTNTTDLSSALDEDLQLNVRMLKLRENQRLLELQKRLDGNAMGAAAHNILAQEWSCKSEVIQLSTATKAFKTGAVTDEDLLQAQKFFEECLSLDTVDVVTRSLTPTSIASCKVQRYRLFGTIPADAALSDYMEYDKIYMKQRLAKSILKGAGNLTARAEFVARWSFTNHYDLAIGTCMEAMGVAQVRTTYHRHIHQKIDYIPPPVPSPSRDKSTLMLELIEWAQKKKARSVAEALGAEIILPQGLLSKVRLDEQAQKLLQQEAELQAKIDQNQEDIVGLNRAVNSVRREMRNYTSLEDIMNLRDGQALNPAQIYSLSKSFGANVTIVDYLYIPTACTALLNNIVPMVYRKGTMRSANIVTKDLDLESINRWVDSYLDDQRLDGQRPLSTDEPALQALYPLVEAAVKLSNPGDPIVICPTDVLFRLPLHAIELPDGQTLIERNPIIYTQSLTILRLCQATAAERSSSRAPEVLAVQALSEADLALPEAADMAFASKIQVRLLQGEALTRTSFLQASGEADLVHFYGHVFSNHPKALDQYLAIRNLEDERVTVQDLFGLHLRPGTHVNLVGCQSGRSQVGINDDLFGLSTALMCAGATSIVATQWSIQMDDAAAFQEAFFDELLMQSRAQHEQQETADGESSDTGRQKCLDMAAAVQQAVIRIMRDDVGHIRAPYHWAPFFLQGCWNSFPILEL